MNLTINELVNEISKVNKDFVYNKKKHKKADLEALFAQAQKAAEGDAFTKPHNPDERTVWPREGSNRAKVMKAMLSDNGCSIDDVMKITGWARGACASFFGTDVYGYRNKDEKWAGCNFGFRRVGSRYFLIVHEDAPARPAYM